MTDPIHTLLAIVFWPQGPAVRVHFSAVSGYDVSAGNKIARVLYSCRKFDSE